MCCRLIVVVVVGAHFDWLVFAFSISCIHITCIFSREIVWNIAVNEVKSKQNESRTLRPYILHKNGENVNIIVINHCRNMCYRSIYKSTYTSLTNMCLCILNAEKLLPIYFCVSLCAFNQVANIRVYVPAKTNDIWSEKQLYR